MHVYLVEETGSVYVCAYLYMRVCARMCHQREREREEESAYTLCLFYFYCISLSAHPFISLLKLFHYQPDRVLKAIMRSARKNVISSSELFDVAQSLELWCVDDGRTHGMERNISMHWIVKYLLDKRKLKVASHPSINTFYTHLVKRIM